MPSVTSVSTCTQTLDRAVEVGQSFGEEKRGLYRGRPPQKKPISSPQRKSSCCGMGANCASPTDSSEAATIVRVSIREV
jgi:hypothetical protein